MPEAFTGSASGNFRPGRPAGFTPDAIVLHRSGGSAAALRSRFHDPASSLSAHYVVGRDGRVEQFVLETDTAFHAGIVVNPTWPLLRPRVNPNFYTIGIELEGARDDDWPGAQTAAAAALIAGVAGRWRIPIDADHVVTHRAIRASSGCPAASCPLDAILAAARSHTAAVRVPRQTMVRTLTRANLRRGAPTLQAPIVRIIAAGTDVVVSEFTEAGERVQGNPFWYSDGESGFFWAGATDVPNPTDDPALSELAASPCPSTDPMERMIPVPGDAERPAAEVEIDRTRFALAAKEFFCEATPKDLIVLHFTAGTSARSAFETWRHDPQHIGTAYLVDVDGTIYEVFPPGFWAAHLGVKGTRNLHDRRSIGIEIVNVGPLQPSGDDPTILNWWPRKSPGAADFTTRFCSLDEKERYVEGEFRGKRHFAAYPDVQVDSVAALVRALCTQFSIPATLPPLARRFTCDLNRLVSYKGVCTHANFRQDKWDIGPAFPWDRLGL